MCTGTLFSIQRYTVHDGPGIRTELFMKGCSLHCRWCSNPESFSRSPEVGVHPSRCIGIDRCGRCLPACERDALRVKEGKVAYVDRSACTSCGTCAKVCPSEALKTWGFTLTEDEALEAILADRSFFETSGGGVTFSGGESLLQWRFVKAVSRRCRENGIHVCIESALNVQPRSLEEVLPFCDMFITDIKHMDSSVHQLHTGVGNERILGNIRAIAASGVPLVLRLPIIPDVNDSEDEIDKVGDFIEHDLEGRVAQVQFLRFRRLGEEKYASLGMEYPMTDVDPEREPFENRIRELVVRLGKRGIPAVAGTTHRIIAAVSPVG